MGRDHDDTLWRSPASRPLIRPASRFQPRSGSRRRPQSGCSWRTFEKGIRRVRISYTATTMAKKPFSAEQEVRHYGVALRQIIRAAGLTVTEVERRLGAWPVSSAYPSIPCRGTRC